MRGRLTVFLRWPLAATFFGVAALAFASVGSAAVVTYPSSQSIAPTGPLPPFGKKALVYNTAIGEREGALLVVTAAQRMAVTVTEPSGGVEVRLFAARFVTAGGRLVPDVLEPW